MKRKAAEGLHEDLRRDHKSAGSSNKSFGLVFAAFCAILGILPLLKGQGPKFPLLGIAAVFLFLAYVIPVVLTPLNFLWTKFGLLLHKVVSPLVMGILFYGVVTPVGQLMRLTGTDPMNREWDPEADTYWIPREQNPEIPRSMKNQF